MKDLNYYEKLLKKYTTKKLICTNPDLIVHRGNEEEYCAGSIAKIFESLEEMLCITANLIKIFMKCVLTKMKKF